MGNRQVSGNSVIVTPQDWRVVEFAAIEGLRLTPNELIGQYITVSAPLDRLGGVKSSSLGYYNTPLKYTHIPSDESLLFTDDEQQYLTTQGYTIIGLNKSKTSIIMGQVVTTYKYNTLGDEDVSFKYLNYIRTGWAILEYMFNNLKADFSTYRLTDGDVQPNVAIANQQTFIAKMGAYYTTLSSTDFMLLQSGGTALAYFYAKLLVTLDIANGTITMTGELPIVTQVRKIIQAFSLSFSIE